MAQTVKNLPIMQETRVLSLDWEVTLEESMEPTPEFLPGKSPWTEVPGRLYRPWGHKESDMTERLSTQHTHGFD